MNTFRLFSCLSIALLFSCVGITLKCMENMESEKLNEEIRRALASNKGRASKKAAVVVSLKRDKESDEAVNPSLVKKLDRESDKHMKKRITRKKKSCLFCFCK